MMKVMTLKAMTFGTLCHLKLQDFSSNYVSNCSIYSRISTHEVFFKFYFKNPCLRLSQNVL